eukprot:15011664-Alexandrium_andersonii.AAC.1
MSASLVGSEMCIRDRASSDVSWDKEGGLQDSSAGCTPHEVLPRRRALTGLRPCPEDPLYPCVHHALWAPNTAGGG